MDVIAQFEAERMAEKPYDSSDPQQVNNARKAAALRETKDLETLRALMQHENGRSLVFDMVKCCFNGNPFVVGDQSVTAFNLGQEATARRFFNRVVRICPDDFCLMVEEHSTEI